MTEFKVNMTMILIILFLFIGCVQPGPVKLDFVCSSTVQQGRIVSECADPETWKAWIEKQHRDTKEKEF